MGPLCTVLVCAGKGEMKHTLKQLNTAVESKSERHSATVEVVIMPRENVTALKSWSWRRSH